LESKPIEEGWGKMNGEVLGGDHSEEPQGPDAVARGFSRGRLLTAAGGAAIGLTAAALAGPIDPALAAVSGPFFRPDEFFVAGETERSAAIAEADKKAAAAGGYVLFGAGVYPFRRTLRISAPWVGIPGRTVLEALGEFKYEKLEGGIEQFVATNAHFSRTFNSTADRILLDGLGWVINTDSGSAGKGSIGLGNVAGGVIRDCSFSTSGRSTMGALLDLFCCVQGVEVDRVNIMNSTGGTAGVGLNVRNFCSVAAVESSNTERIVIRDSVVGTSTADEAIAVYGVIGLTRNVRIIDTTVEALPQPESSQQHIHIASTFPLANPMNGTKAGVEDVEWRGCRFVDVTGFLKENGNLLSFGREGDEKNVCQNIRAVDCGFTVHATAAKVAGLRNTPNTFNGKSSGNYLQNPRVDATGSTGEIEMGIVGFPSVRNPTILGNVSYGLRTCDRVLGGTVEAVKRAFSACGEVSGVTAFLTEATAIAAQYDASTAPTASMRGCLIEGGQFLVLAGSMSSDTRIDISDNRMVPGATAGNVVVNESDVHLRVVGNTISTAGLTPPPAGYDPTTRTQSILNDWNGTPEGV
jgi:hypothetical protein